MHNHREPVIEWLLEWDDPGVRFFTLRDLLRLSPEDPQVVEARQATVNQSPVKEILQAQREDGSWVQPGPGYYPKYTGTLWQVTFLGQFGAWGEDKRVRAAANYVLENSRTTRGGISAGANPSGLIHCLQGNVCASLLELGLEADPRLQQALDWLARSVVGEGIAPSENRQAEVRYLRSGNSGPGFLCSANNHVPCAWGAIPAMDALAKVRASSRTPVMEKAIKAGIEFLFSCDPAAAQYPRGWSQKPNQSWFKFGYPLGYVTDVLRNVEVLVSLGMGHDPRLKKAGELILSKRRPDGRWLMEYSYNGKTWCDIEAKGEPSKWVSLRALRALAGMGIED